MQQTWSRQTRETVIEAFAYPAGLEPTRPVWEGYPSLEEVSPEGSKDRTTASPVDGATTAEAESCEELADERRKGFEEGRLQGMEEGRRAEREALRAACDKELARQGQKMADLVAQFDRARDQYLHSAEREVVTLALAVAARILRREAQMDPLLLTGAVRVALGQIAQSTEVRLKIPACDFELWNEAIQHLPALAGKPIVMGVEGMRTGDCEVETAMGKADLGIRAQLSEIERGFFDRPMRPVAEEEAGAAVEGRLQP